MPDGVLNVVPGYGEEAGEPLGRHPDVDKVAFTGSVEVGRRFLTYAGESNGKQVSLELGGKSPQVVLADAADLGDAAEAIGWGIFYNAGQTCHAGSRVVVERPVAQELVARLRDVAAGFVPADPLLDSTVLGAMISDEHLSGVLDRVSRGVADGARLLAGGSRVEPVAGGAYMEPTVLEADDPQLAVVQEEVFGPVLVVQVADDVEHALALANQTRYGLAAAVWTSSVREAGRLARRLRAGTVWVNTFDASSLATPFGGMRDSGHGRDRSLHALDSSPSSRRPGSRWHEPRRLHRAWPHGLAHVPPRLHRGARGDGVRSRSPGRSRRRPLRRAGCRVVGGLVEGAEVLITSLPGPPQVDAVVSQALVLLAPGALAIEMSTSSLEVGRRLRSLARSRKIDFVDAPVAGQTIGAEAGTLAIYAGGTRKAFGRALPLLEAIGDPARVLTSAARAAATRSSCS